MKLRQCNKQTTSQLLPGKDYVVNNWALDVYNQLLFQQQCAWQMSPWQSFWAHFSSALLLKEQMIISVKKVKNACQIWSLVKFAHIPSKSTIFYWLLFGEVCPENSCKIGQFLHELVSENPAKFDFFPRPIRSPDYFITFQTSPNPLSFYFRKKIEKHKHKCFKCQPKWKQI